MRLNESLLATLLSMAFLQDEDGEDGSENGEENGGDSDDPGDEDGPDTDGADGPDHEPRDHHDPINNADTQERDREVEVNQDHPFGDYARALFDHAKEFADKLAEDFPEAQDLKEIFDEAERARDLYESWNKATTTEGPSLLGGESLQPDLRGSLVENHMKIELVGLYLGLSATSTTGGRHNPGSAHYLSGAVDFSVRGMSLARIEQAMWAMRNAGIFVRDERGRPLRASGAPQAAWSNPHIHAQSVPIDPARNGPLDRWSNPPFQEGTFMEFNRRSEPPVPPGSRPSGRRLP